MYSSSLPAPVDRNPATRCADLDSSLLPIDTDAYPSDASCAGSWRSPWRTRLRWRWSREALGVVAVVIVFVGIASLFAVQQPPFVAPDETAHLGYAHEIADLRLPEIDRAPSVPASATQWIAERDSASEAEYLGVWVANHPPLTYVAAAPLIWLSESAGSADGGLLALRMVNIVFCAAGIAMTYLLATELTGVKRLGLAAAAVAALIPQGHVVFSQGLNDGLAFAAGTAVLWAGCGCCGAERHGVS